MTRIHTLKSDDPARLELITQLLNAGHRAADIAETIGVTRERVRQLIKDYIDKKRLRIPCQLCGKVMGTSWGLQRLYHPACAVIADKATRRKQGERSRAKGWHQRKQPDGEFEEAALAAYTKRGYDVSWLPAQAPFDYVVNGLSVDVKGAYIRKDGRYHSQMPLSPRGPEPIDMASRCDLAHCIGKTNGAYQHFIIPTGIIGARYCMRFYPVPQLYICEQCGAQFPTWRGLRLHETRWCGHAPNWQQYKDNWWRFGDE